MSPQEQLIADSLIPNALPVDELRSIPKKRNITRMPSPKKKHMSVTLMDGLLLAHSFSLVVASGPRNKNGNMEKVKK
jgi:hypothetical protein